MKEKLNYETIEDVFLPEETIVPVDAPKYPEAVLDKMDLKQRCKEIYEGVVL